MAQKANTRNHIPDGNKIEYYVDLPDEVECPECNGTGYDPLDGGQCDRCNGTGFIDREQ